MSAPTLHIESTDSMISMCTYSSTEHLRERKVNGIKCPNVHVLNIFSRVKAFVLSYAHHKIDIFLVSLVILV